MKSKIFRLIRKVLSEISGALVISALVIAIFIAIFANEGIMRIVAPVIVFAVGLLLYWLSSLIADKKDRD
ncbi:hypothetical protein [Serratia rhizosphaerae]|uniref:Uncharacterized protein n=1 Tax=Serratia rhizosphaerae TaxID=2597702 RepID=A0ABX6GR66_9GAMM|nr:hypothetical protein [Serratia rhizosphaerae]QHA88766.1 hypothetical protein FO014_18285 [Serratia rhizosphaerae]